MPAMGLLWDALRSGYYITFDDKSEIKAMLRECEEFDILWRDGEKPMGFIPSGFVPAIDYGTHRSLYCQLSIGITQKCVKWADLVSSRTSMPPMFNY